MSLTLLKRSKEESAVLAKRAADRAAILRSGERRFGNRSERVARLETLVTQKAKNISVQIVRAGFRHHVDDAARRTAELRRKRIADYLKFLHRLLTDSRFRSVDGVVGVIGAIDLHQVRA